MKRKALLILAAAILAVAMIPAIGVGAATGDVKIVTPDELANPSGGTGSAFDKLSETNFVSDKTGTTTSLEDAGGTLYVVIEDNDPDANPLTDYAAYFATPTVTAQQGGRSFGIISSVTADAGVDQISDKAANVNVDDNDNIVLPEGISFGDRNRDGVLDDEDITVSIGVYTAATAGEDDPATTTVDESKVGFASPSNLPSSVFIRFAEDNTVVFLNTAIITAGSSLRITFASATAGDLNYPDDFSTENLRGLSRVQVTSSSGDPIRIEANEKNLAGYAAQTAGVNSAAFAAASSKDSGVFVGRFGVIRNDFKDAISDYWAAVPAPESVERTVTVITQVAEDLENVTEAEAAAAAAADPNTTVVAGTPNDNTVGPGSSTVIVLTGVDKDNTLVADSLDVKFNVGDDAGGTARTTTIDTTAANNGVTTGNPDATSGAVIVTVVTDADTVANDGGTSDDDSADTFTVTYKTESSSGVIDAMLAVVDGTGVDSNNDFDDFCDDAIDGDRDDKCAEAVKLRDAVNAHSSNLGITTGTDRVDEFLDAVIGVEHGDTVSVRYSDHNPRGTRTDSAEADLVGPTIGGFTLADGAYIDEDDFEVLFDVTDTDSGILEDSHDTSEAEIKDGLAYVNQVVTVAGRETGPPNEAADLDVDDRIDDGERYELTLDVTTEAEAAEGDKDSDPVTIKVTIKIAAYDAARNVSTKTVSYTVDTIDPVLQKVITGWGVKSRSGDAFVLVENQRDRIALVFDDTVQGDLVEAQDVSVPGSVVLRVMWLNNTGNNKIDVGDTGQGTGSATDLDENDETATSGAADDVVEDDLNLLEDTSKQDARHILFLTLDEPLPTDATPTVEIDNNDLIDLAGNENRADHRSVAEDRLAPSFEVTLGEKLSNGDLNVTIVASEGLDRRPRAELALGADSISVVPSDNGDNNYSIDKTRANLGIAGKGADDGVWTLSITGVDENDNVGTSSVKWELDTTANNGAKPDRRGGKADALIAHELEVNEIIFLTVEFAAEADEYDEGRGTDSSKTIDVTGLTLETLAAGDIPANNKAKARSARTIEATMDVDAMSSQTNNNVKHVVALADLEQGNYNLKVDYMDVAGNTGTFDYIFQVIAPKPAEIDITPGWTLISIPGRPQNPAIDAVFENSAVTEVWSLNNTTKAWEFARKSPVDGTWGESTLDQITDGRGYFVRSSTFDPVSVLLQRFSPQREPPMYNITSGWNSIGYTPAGSEESIAVDGYLGALGISGWGMIRTWNADSTPPQYETYYSSGAATAEFPTDGDNGPAIVEAGKGYLLFATRAGTIGG